MSNTEQPSDSVVIKAEQAFELYDAMGPDRTLNKLWRYFCDEKAKGNPVPTTNRPTVYAWAKQFRWDHRLLQREIARNGATQEQVARMRTEGYDLVLSYQKDAIETLSELMIGSTNDRVRLEAVRMILDRTGILDLSKAKNLPIDNDRDAASRPIDGDMTDEQLLEMLREKVK